MFIQWMDKAGQLSSVISNVHYVLSPAHCFVCGSGLVERAPSWDSDGVGSSDNFGANYIRWNSLLTSLGLVCKMRSSDVCNY